MMRIRRKAKRIGRLLAAVVLCLMGAGAPRAQSQSFSGQAASRGEATKAPTYEVEYYYKVQWGHADEWLALFKKNHLPVLKALKEQGRIVEIEMERPRYHMTEDGRWDFRVTIAWKDFAATNDPATEQALVRQLFRDQETFKREEQRRFEILLAHWDVPVLQVSRGGFQTRPYRKGSQVAGKASQGD